MIHIYLVFFIAVCSANGQLQCPSCTYITISPDLDIPNSFRGAIESVLGLFQDDACSKDLKAPVPEIKEATCPVEEGKENRCSFYAGDLTLKIPLFGTGKSLVEYEHKSGTRAVNSKEAIHVKKEDNHTPLSNVSDLDIMEIPFKIYQRGCYSALSANIPANKCHDRNNINEDKTFLKHIVDQSTDVLSSWDVASFKGQLCLCSTTYCSDVSGVSQGAVIYPLLLVLQIIALYFL